MDDTLLELKDLGVAFNGNQLFKGINLKVPRGSVTVIVGTSGVGKTTLLKLIAGLSKPTQGQILVHGKNISDENRFHANQNTVMVTQQPNLWDHLTALDNVALVRQLIYGHHQKQARAWATAKLSELQVNHVAHRYPFLLSGGEQQRISLARGLATDRSLFLLDEVTSSIDKDRKTIIATTILNLARDGKGIVFVTHDLVAAQLVSEKPLELTAEGLVELDPGFTV